LNGSVGASLDPVRNFEFDVVIATSPPSSLRKQGPITTGGRYFPISGIIQDSATLTDDSASS
jgi:hypothetical protein